MSDSNQQNKNPNSRLKVIVGFIALGALCRLFPHPFNFTPIAAMGLFAGTYIMNKKLAMIIPLTAMLLSDILLQILHNSGFHDQMFFVYASIAIITSLGFLLRGREQRQTIMVASLVGSIIFFILTNFGTFTTGMYGFTTSGLSQCYVMAIPFFRGTVMGDLFYNLVLFGGFAFVRWASPIFIGKNI